MAVSVYLALFVTKVMKVVYTTLLIFQNSVMYKLFHATAAVLKFISKLRKEKFSDNTVISVAEINLAKQSCIKDTQQSNINDEKFSN